MWEGPPTDKTERSGKVKGKQGKGLGEKKGRREGKLHNCKSTPVQPVSAMRGEGREGGGVSAETDGWCGRCAAVGEREWLERGKLTGAGEGGRGGGVVGVARLGETQGRTGLGSDWGARNGRERGFWTGWLMYRWGYSPD
jgi:hypothetical protein